MLVPEEAVWHLQAASTAGTKAELLQAAVGFVGG